MKRYEKIIQDTTLVLSFALPVVALLGIFSFFMGCGFLYFY